MNSRGPKGNAAQKSPTRPNIRQPLPHEARRPRRPYQEARRPRRLSTGRSPSPRSCLLAFLKKPSNQKTPQHFTIALLGSWGACDGCKQRLMRFAQIWEQEARRYMKVGVRATLVITYKYMNPAETFERKWGSTTYGWAADGDRGPCFHTIEADAISTNDKVK